MRNPLGAIMLCADGIATSVKDFQSSEQNLELIEQTKSLLESNLDAAQTIVLCAQHQKRIIDDVLTLSKLNSTMVHVTPVSAVARYLGFQSIVKQIHIQPNYITLQTSLYCHFLVSTRLKLNI
jgi:signal transduction histidine kinase